MLYYMKEVPDPLDNFYMKKLTGNPDSRDDGHTNGLGEEIVDLINEFLRVSYVLVVGMISFSIAFDTMPDLWEIDDTFKNMKDDYVYNRISRNIHRFCTSLRSQRSLYRLVKKKVRANELDKNWYTYLKRNIEKTMERPGYLMRILKENLAMTPFTLYNEYLRENGITFMQDMENVIASTNDGSVYGIDYDACHDAVVDHIHSCIKEASKNQRLLNRARMSAVIYKRAIERRKQQRMEEEKEKKAQLLASKQQEAREILYDVRRCADNMFVNAIRRLPGDMTPVKNKTFYVVGVIKIPKTRTDFDRKVWYVSSTGLTSSSIVNARRYLDRDDAQKGADSILSRHDTYVAEIIEVDIRNMVAV